MDMMWHTEWKLGVDEMVRVVPNFSLSSDYLMTSNYQARVSLEARGLYIGCDARNDRKRKHSFTQIFKILFTKYVFSVQHRRN